MSKWVIIDGEGSFRYGGSWFKPGATEIPDDHPIVERIEAGKAPEWVILSDTRDLGQPEPPPPPPPDREQYEPFAGRDGKWYFYGPKGQSIGYLDEDAALAGIEDAKEEAGKVPLAEEISRHTGPEPGTMTTEDFAAMSGAPVACRQPGCDRTFRNTGGRANHERVRHPQLWSELKGGTRTPLEE
jgi:hypothetical protein